LNSISTIRKNDSIAREFLADKASMTGDWAGYKIFNHPNNSFIVDVSVRLSKPCGII